MMNLPARLSRVLLWTALAAAGPALALDVPPPPAPTVPNAVNIGWMVYVPAVITVKPGTTITWTNTDDSNHGVQFPDQKSPRLNKGETYSRTFTAPGEYPYQCQFHGARMTGKVVVK
jgi:plastocyanin